MTPELFDEAVVNLLILFGLFAVLLIGCIVSDYIFPHIRPLNRWFDSLPEYEDDEIVYQEFLDDCRARREARRRRRAERRKTAR